MSSPATAQRAPQLLHLFGGLWLEPPTSESDRHKLRHLEQLRPYLKDLEDRSLGRDQIKSTWDYRLAFERMTKAETAIWSQHGVQRNPFFMVRPCGPLQARIACHLHCPSFSIADPYQQHTSDDSNICIKQLLDIGFTPDCCLIYDHLSRREALDGLQFYPPEIIRIHESFLCDLREHMSATVEVCWGSLVRERMKKILYLTPLNLPGRYRGVQVWLEWQQSLARFNSGTWQIARLIIFVQHPQRMLYGRRGTEGVLQDLHLSVAAKLAQVTINEQFYTVTHKPGTYGKLTSWQQKRQQSLNAAAIHEVSSCTSFQPLSTTSSSSENHEQLNDFSTFRARLELPGVSGDIAPKPYPEVAATAQVLQPAAVLGQPCQDHQDKGMHILVTTLLAAGASLSDALLICGLCSSEGQQSSRLYTWEDIPLELRKWLQTQKGLQIDSIHITSTAQLLRTYRLLCRKQPQLNLNEVGIITIALDTAIRYYKQIELIGRESSLTDLVYDGIVPRDVMPRKCGLCSQRILDDAKARYKLTDPERYILRFLQNGCGQPLCPGDQKGTWALPEDPAIKYIRPDRQKLLANPRKAKWEDYFIQTKPIIQAIPEHVLIKCRNCQAIHYLDQQPRWTRETKPRYILRRPRCQGCDSKNTNWTPVDPGTAWVDPSKLSRKWKGLMKRPDFEPDNVLENPDWYFP